MHAVKFYRRYWAAIGGLIFVALAFFVGLFGEKDTPYGFAQYQADEFEVRHGIASLFRKN